VQQFFYSSFSCFFLLIFCDFLSFFLSFFSASDTHSPMWHTNEEIASFAKISLFPPSYQLLPPFPFLFYSPTWPKDHKCQTDRQRSSKNSNFNSNSLCSAYAKRAKERKQKKCTNYVKQKYKYIYDERESEQLAATL